MGEWHLNNPDQQLSPDSEHIDVLKNIENEDRDSRRVLVHQIWVYLAVHKRERADGDPKVADEAWLLSHPTVQFAA